MAEARKKVIWELAGNTMKVSDDSTLADMEKKYSFQLERFKDTRTHVERLRVTSYVFDKEQKKFIENGYADMAPHKIYEGLKELRQFGVILGDTYIRDLAKRIAENYLGLDATPIDVSDEDKQIDDVIAKIKEYAATNMKYTDQDFYYVPVDDFNNLAGECGCAEYEMKALRSQLDLRGYLRTTPGRYSIVKKFNDKNERVMAFKIKKINPPPVQDKAKEAPATTSNPDGK